MKKKILALTISLTMVIGSFGGALAVPADVVGTPYEESVGRLFDLGIVIGYPDGTYGPNDNITREEYSVIAIKTKQLTEKANISKGDTVFGDITPNSWSSGYVNVAEAEKLIVGLGKVNGVNTFGPKMNLTYEQAVAIVLRAIGYEPEVAAKGGWPNGYLAVASDIGLLDGINGTKGMLATRGMVAELTYNALEIPTMIKVGSDYIVSGTQGTKKVYLFNDLHMINEAAASGNWGSINKETFALAGIAGVNAANLTMIKDKLELLADGDNQNWSPKAIQGVIDGGVEPAGPVEITYIDSSVIEADGKTYTMTTGTVLRNELGVIEYTGGVAIDGALDIGDKIFDIVANSNNRISSMKYLAPELTATKAVVKAEASALAADIAAAQVLVNGLAAGTVKTNLQNRLDAIVVGSPVVPVTAGLNYINAKEFEVTLPTGATGTYVVRVGAESQTLTSSGRVTLPGALWTLGEIRTVELVKLSSLSDVLASKNFVVKAATGITGSDAAPTPGVAPVTAVAEVPGVDTIVFGGTFTGGQTVTIDGITLPALTGGNNIATAANVKTLVGAHGTLGPKYTVVDDFAGKLTFTENTGNVDGVALTATTSSNVGTLAVANTTLGIVGVAPSPGTAQVNTLTIAGPATAAGEIKVTFNDGGKVAKTVVVDNGDTATIVAGNIATEFASLSAWTVTASGAIVTFTANAPAANKTVTITVVEK